MSSEHTEVTLDSFRSSVQDYRTSINLNENVVMLIKKTSLLTAPQVVILTTLDTASDKKIVKRLTFSFQWFVTCFGTWHPWSYMKQSCLLPVSIRDARHPKCLPFMHRKTYCWRNLTCHLSDLGDNRSSFWCINAMILDAVNKGGEGW